MKKIGFLFGALAMALFSASCGSSGSGSNGNVTGNGPTQVKAVDKTDTSRCQGAVPAGASVYQRWTARQEAANGLNFDLTLDIQTNSITFQSTCSYQNQTQVAQVTVPATITDTTISVLRSDSREANNGTLRCSVNAPAGTFNYQLEGDCVSLSYQGQKQYFTRAR